MRAGTNGTERVWCFFGVDQTKMAANLAHALCDDNPCTSHVDAADA
jgi:hypothetical protein